MEARFLAKIDKDGENGCWLWTASVNNKAYGTFNVDGRPKKAHRVAYELWKGEIPDGLLVRHKCDVRSCVNPEHLETGTNQDNMDDKMKRGRHNGGRGETHGSAKLTEAQVIDIRSRVGQLQRETMKEFGISRTHIWRILNGKSRN